MAIKYISELTAVTSISNTDVLVIDDGEHNYKITWQAFKALLGSVASFTVNNTAGTISITLANGQTLTVTPHDPTKQDTLQWDSTPTAGSTKPVTSGGVKAALDLKLDAEDYANFTGATGSGAGTAGIVPAPGAQNMYLSSNGTWESPDSAPTANSNKLATSGGIKAALDGKQNTLTIDTALDSTSTNPVQNKAIATEINDINEAISDLGDAVGDIDEELDKVVHVDSVQTFTEQEQYNARASIGAIGYNVYGRKRFGVSGIGQSSPSLTRLYDAVGMTATPSTDATAGSSDFDAYAPFNRRKCVGYWTAGDGKAIFHVNAYEGDADYTEDGTMGDYVAVDVEPFYYYDKDGIMAVSMYPWPGYEIHPVCKDYDGNVRAHTYLPVYALAQDANGKAVSLPGFQNQRGGYSDLRTYAATYNATGISSFAMIAPEAVNHYEWLLMTIEFATTNMQSIMEGAADMRYNTKDVITAVPAANKVVMGSTGSNFVVGQTVQFDSAHDSSIAVSRYNRITAIEKCNSDGTPNASGSYYLITYDGTDRSDIIVVNSWKISSRPWCTGATGGFAPGVNAVKGHTGAPVHLTNGKYPMRYRWRENVYGNQNMTTLDLADLRVASGSDYFLEWYYLADPRKYTPFGNFDKATIQNTAKGWVKLGVTTPVASYVNGYIKELGSDSNYPWIKVPVLTSGGGSTTYYCDYAPLVSSYEVRAVRRGGHVSNGAYAGPCFFSANYAPSNASWYFGAALYMLQLG